MNFLKMVFLVIILWANGLVLFAMHKGMKGVEDKTSRKGLLFLKGCLIADIVCIIGGAFLW